MGHNALTRRLILTTIHTNVVRTRVIQTNKSD